jgi:hypothetical protein
MFARKSRTTWGLVATTAVLAGGGCLFPGVPASLTELPAELQVVVDDPSSFAQAPGDPLASVAPGTVVDDLGGLTGCWGWYEEAAGPLVAFYEVYQFDAGNGTVSRWVFTPGFLLIPSLFALDQGSFTALDDGRIEIQLDHYTIIEMRTGIGREFTELPAEIGTAEKLVTLDGDQLLIAVPYYVDEQTGEPAGRIFTRFGCPE